VNRTTVLLGPTPLDTKIAQSHRDETVFGVRGVAPDTDLTSASIFAGNALIDAKSINAQYIRVYSNGNTSNDTEPLH
jgi:hypothetical protein